MLVSMLKKQSFQKYRAASPSMSLLSKYPSAKLMLDVAALPSPPLPSLLQHHPEFSQLLSISLVSLSCMFTTGGKEVYSPAVPASVGA
jgi:hypothetical protein